MSVVSGTYQACTSCVSFRYTWSITVSLSLLYTCASAAATSFLFCFLLACVASLFTSPAHTLVSLSLMQGAPANVQQDQMLEYEALGQVFEAAKQGLTAGEPASAFTCPITMEVFRDPVMSPSGLSYERSALLEHLNKVRHHQIQFQSLSKAVFAWNTADMLLMCSCKLSAIASSVTGVDITVHNFSWRAYTVLSSMMNRSSHSHSANRQPAQAQRSFPLLLPTFSIIVYSCLTQQQTLWSMVARQHVKL